MTLAEGKKSLGNQVELAKDNHIAKLKMAINTLVNFWQAVKIWLNRVVNRIT
jgi:hypothetical protein